MQASLELRATKVGLPSKLTQTKDSDKKWHVRHGNLLCLFLRCKNSRACQECWNTQVKPSVFSDEGGLGYHPSSTSPCLPFSQGAG